MVEFVQQLQTRNIPEFAKLLIKEEGSGILNFFIQGAVQLLRELDETGSYVLTAEQEARVVRLVSESNSVREFVKAWVAPSTDENVTTNELIEGYMKFCQQLGWHPLPAHTVQRQLPDAMMEIHHAALRHDMERGNGTQRGYEGMQINWGVPNAA